MEVYANPEYGFSMLALFGAAGYIGVTWRPASPGTLDFACGAPIWVPPAAVVPGGILGGAGELPVLVALLCGPLVFLLAGLGGWV